MSADHLIKGKSEIYGREVSILEAARGNVVRSVNSEMVTAYWLIGREIVEEVQNGEEQADYGGSVIDNLSSQLNERFGKGFSRANLFLFRQFYLAFKDRALEGSQKLSTQRVDNSDFSSGTPLAEFMPSLGWSHCRALMRVEHPDARAYYELEAELRKERMRIEERAANYG